MSIGSGDVTPAGDPTADPPYYATQVALSGWPDRVKRAWQVFDSVKQGDTLIWGDRSKALVVQDVSTNEDGFKNVDVEGPRGGTYTLRERYDDNGNPRFYADDSKAMDLEYVEGDTDNMRSFTERMYENTVENLKRAAINNYVEMDYETNDYRAAVRDVVSSWIQDVEFERWSGWPYEWQDGDSTYIFRMVREHSGELPELSEEDDQNTRTSPKSQARDILEREVYSRGREMAHSKLIQSNDDYRANVMQLADEAVERADVKAQMDAREATISVVEDFIDAHSEPLYRSILEYSERQPDDIELYQDLDQEDITREMALDILDADVWERAKELHRERGTHDPTIRGIAFFEYDDLVETLVEETLREHQINSNRLLYTTANEVVRNFADNVEDHEWPYDVGGVSERTWGAGDVEDIFSSIVMHAETDPQLFNPFSRNKERKMAHQVLTEVVHERASNALDEQELEDAKPIPADEYLDEHFGDITFNDIRDDSGIGPNEYIKDSLDALSDEEWDRLAGWTFVDELVEEANAVVPYMSGPWVLVDYGLVMEDVMGRRLSWFNRDTGDVLTLAGSVTQPATNGEYEFDDTFGVQLVTWDGKDEPVYLVEPTNIEYAFEFVRDFIEANQTDVNIIETSQGSHYIQEAITEDDIDTSQLTRGIAPNFNIPGPGFNIADTLAFGGEAFRKVGRYLQDNNRIVAAISSTAVMLSLSEATLLLNRVAPSINIRPDYDKKHGIGIRASYQFGADEDDLERYNPDDPDSQAFTGKIDGTVKITPGAVKFLGDMATPEWIFKVDQEGRTTSAITNLKERVEDPIRRKSGDFGRSPRRAFLAAHFPANASGRPANVDEYEEEKTPSIRGREVSSKYENAPEKPLEEDRVEELLSRVAQFGYQRDTGAKGYYWSGDRELRRRLAEAGDKVEQNRKNALTPAEVQELGYSLERDYLYGTDSMVGPTEEVVENYPKRPVCTNKAFLKIYTDLPGTPNTTMLDTVWMFYQNRAKESDTFTILDAYDRYRMGLVYDAADTVQTRVLSEMLSDAADGDFSFTDSADTWGAMWRKPRQTEYLWNVDGELHASEVFDQTNSVDKPIIFTTGNRPPNDTDYYWWDGSADQYYYHRAGEEDGEPVEGFRTENDPPDDARTITLTRQADVWSYLLPSVKKDINEQILDSGDLSLATENREWEPGESEEMRKWLDADEATRLNRIATDSVSWDDLDGTDLSVWGLFIRGLDMESTAALTDRFNLSDRFQTRLSDVLPSTLDPVRPDIPSFEEWIDRRRGRNAIGSASDKARSKARYLREVAGTANNAIPTRDALGWSPGVEDESDRMRDAREHYEETDYENYEQFYGNEFGNAFDDVANKFVEQQPQRDPADLDYVDAMDEDFEASETERRESDNE